jgi:hypothetical protein
MSEKEILEIATPIMDNLMEASTQIDHEKHVKDFSERMKSIVTKENLENMCKQYQEEKGYFTDREPIAVFKRPDSVAIIWKQLFSKVPGEYVAEMVLIKKNNKYLVDHAMVF